jgi:hypothetical protein
MQKRVKNIFLLGLIVCVALYCSGCATYMKHPDFDKRHKNIKTVSVVEPDVEVYNLTFKGERALMTELLEPIASYSKEESEKSFRQKGYILNKLDLSKEALEKEPSLKTELFNIRRLFNQRLDDITKAKQKKFTYSLGADINILSNISDSNVLIFVKVSAVKKSAGEIAKDLTKTLVVAAVTLGSVVVFYSHCWCLIQVAVVDGDTGDILWYNHNTATAQNLDAAREKEMRRAICSLFEPFPQIAKEATAKETPTAPQTEPAYEKSSL